MGIIVGKNVVESSVPLEDVAEKTAETPVEATERASEAVNTPEVEESKATEPKARRRGRKGK